MVPRRNALRLLGAGLVGLAGCAGREGEQTPTRPSASSTDAPAGTTTRRAETETSTTTEPRSAVEVEGSRPSWTRELDAPVYDPPVYADGHVVVAAGESLYGLDTGTGETAWTLDPPPNPEGDVQRLDARFAVREGTVYALVGVDNLLGGSDYTLLALEPDGTETWRYASGYRGYHVPLGFGDGALVVSTRDDAIDVRGQEVFAVGLDDGRERWSAPSGDVLGGAVGSGVVANLAGDQVLDCFDLESGDRRFRFEPDGDRSVDSVAVGGGHVFAGVDSGGTTATTLQALDPTTGERAWAWDEMRVDSLRYVDDLYVGGGSIFRLAPDRTERWRYDYGGTVHASPWYPLGGVPFDDDALYTNTGVRLAAVRRDDGTERWSIRASSRTLPVALAGDSVLLNHRGMARVSALGIDGEHDRWIATASGSFLAPAAGDDAAYLVSRSGTVLRLPA